MFGKVLRVALLPLAGALPACDRTPPTSIRPPAITGAFALRLVEGNPLPILVREPFDLLGYPDRLLVADTLLLTADRGYDHRMQFKPDSAFGTARPPASSMSGVFTQRGDTVSFGLLGRAVIHGDSLFMIAINVGSLSYERRLYSRAAR